MPSWASGDSFEEELALWFTSRSVFFFSMFIVLQGRRPYVGQPYHVEECWCVYVQCATTAPPQDSTAEFQRIYIYCLCSRFFPQSTQLNETEGK